MNWAVVMAGGKGTRFWPESRARRPKPFLKLLGRRTLLRETVDRLRPLLPPRRILIVLQEELVREARRLLPEIPRENILGEPVGRSTAACAVYGASLIARRDPKARIAFLPADQQIEPRPEFRKTLRLAFELADEKPVLFGIRPTSPDPSYGYLEVGARRAWPLRKGRNFIFTVLRFREKPDRRQARQFLKRGNFLWNGGIFVWQLEAFEEAVKRYLPRHDRAFHQLAAISVGARRASPLLGRIYRTLPSISLDYGILEKMPRAHALLGPFHWHDVGGWPGLADFWPSDSRKNRIQGKVILVHSRGNIVRANKRLIALAGVRDLIVVETEDAVLVCPRSETDRIRDIVRELERRKAYQYL